jgi:hypothetical protein
MHPVRPCGARNFVTASSSKSRTRFLPGRRAGVLNAVALYSIAIRACHRCCASLVHFPNTACEVALQHSRVSILHALWIGCLHAFVLVSEQNMSRQRSSLKCNRSKISRILNERRIFFTAQLMGCGNAALNMVQVRLSSCTAAKPQ